MIPYDLEAMEVRERETKKENLEIELLIEKGIYRGNGRIVEF